MSAGYSGTPLVRKLGLKPGMKAAFVDAPNHYVDLLGGLPHPIHLLALPGRDMDFVHFFAAGLVDVKICAVDEDWSGLKFVYRTEDRW